MITYILVFSSDYMKVEQVKSIISEDKQRKQQKQATQWSDC